MYFAFVRTLSIESGNSNLLKLKREMCLKFQLTKGRKNTAVLQRLMEPEIKCHQPPSIFITALMYLLHPDKVHKAKNIVTNRFQPPTHL